MPDAPAVPLRIAVVGLGAVGHAVAGLVRADAGLELAAGVDIRSAALASAGHAFAGVPLGSDVLSMPPADVAVVCGGRRFDRLAPTFRELMARKTPLVSDCAEMAWPWLRHPHLADVVANEARKAGVPLVGVGAEPAVIEAVLARLNVDETRVAVGRTVDWSRFRRSVADQAGVGRTAAQFRKLATDGLISLPGLGELVVLISQRLGRHPMRADVRTTFKPVTDAAGVVVGLTQTAAWEGGGLDVRVETSAMPDAGGADRLTVATEKMEAIDLPAGDETAASLVRVARTLATWRAGLWTPLDRKADEAFAP